MRRTPATNVIFRGTVPRDGIAWREWQDRRVEEREREREQRRIEVQRAFEEMFLARSSTDGQDA